MAASRFAFLTEAQFDQLLADGQRSQVRSDFDPLPVVKLFTPDAGATWLLGGIDPDAPTSPSARATPEWAFRRWAA
ncbi:2-polyprenyl-6-methoxyphenol hydroxylase-like FAD-dependent oxidoreductase [Variovorax paradoxus]|nr:2-polyprenyl-6-methoxyphenol hydroxylase-like FAD-dependent oxidoreductase [Variovorax paradoxus]